MADQPDPLPPLADLTSVFSAATPAEQIRRAQAEVLPVLTGQMKSISSTADDVYGDAWRELVTLAPRPAPRDPYKARDPLWSADCSWLARPIRGGRYRTFNQAGRRAAYLQVRAGIETNGAELRGRLSVIGEGELGVFAEDWHYYRDECLALLEAGAPQVWSDLDLPGPPYTTLANHIDRLLASHPEWICLSSWPATADWSSESAFRRCRWGVLCLLPILIGIVEAALGRQPSVRILHQRLCAWLSGGKEESGQYEPAHISKAVRYKVFERDGFRCVMCGATAASGAKLEVDHIIPRAKGGGNAMYNLQTLCDRCNGGKSAALSPDLRRRP